MAYMGARAKTAQEMRNVLKLPDDKKEVAAKYKDLLSKLEGREKVATLSLANRIYVNKKFQLVPSYNQMVKDSFMAEAEAIDIVDPNKASSIVNNWVDNQTRGKIKDLVSSNDMSKMELIVLNAIYFKGQWEYKFNPKLTKKRNFRVSDQKSVPVEMMSLFQSFRAAHDSELGAKIIELPYRNSSLSMLIFLPDQVDGLSELEKKIVGFKPKLSKMDVTLRLPKFKIEFFAQLNKVLVAMGIQDAFEKSADFKDLVENSNVHVKKVIHKAFIEVNEEGAEAAAATALLFVRYSMPMPSSQMVFNADHPFAYVIRDRETIYFQGHFVKPNE
nr:GH08778p [Drosophila melanogaster]